MTKHKTFSQYVLFLSILLVFVFSSCSKDSKYSSIKGRGKDSKQTLSLSNFSSVAVYDNINLIIDPTLSSDIAIVEGGENLIPNISLKISDNKLIIRDLNKLKWVYNYKSDVQVTVSGEKISKLFLNDAASIISNGILSADTLYIESSDAAGSISLEFQGKKLHIYAPLGLSDMTFSGNCESFYSYINDMHFLDAAKLQTQYAQIHHLGTNLIKAPNTQQLGVSIENIGDVCYSGSPVILWNESKKSGKLVSGCE